MRRRANDVVFSGSDTEYQATTYTKYLPTSKRPYIQNLGTLILPHTDPYLLWNVFFCFHSWGIPSFKNPHLLNRVAIAWKKILFCKESVFQWVHFWQCDHSSSAWQRGRRGQRRKRTVWDEKTRKALLQKKTGTSSETERQDRRKQRKGTEAKGWKG